MKNLKTKVIGLVRVWWNMDIIVLVKHYEWTVTSLVRHLKSPYPFLLVKFKKRKLNENFVDISSSVTYTFSVFTFTNQCQKPKRTIEHLRTSLT